MATKDQADKLARAIQDAGLAETVNVTASDDRIAILCRVHKDREPKWLEIIKNILLAADDEAKEVHAWKCHFCRNYFLKEFPGGDRRMVFGWNFSIQSKEMAHSLMFVIKLLHGQPIRENSRKELSEFPLQAGPDRNAPKNGRGVRTIGTSDFHPARTK